MSELEQVKDKEKQYVSPDVVMCPSDEYDSYHIEIQLPGVEKEKISLKMLEESFFIKAEAEDRVYIGSYALCCPVNQNNVKAVYKNGLLKIDVPFKEPEFKSEDIKIN